MLGIEEIISRFTEMTFFSNESFKFDSKLANYDVSNITLYKSNSTLLDD